MGRAIYRRGLNELMTSAQLAKYLTLPLYRVLTGSAQVSFSNSSPASYSSPVWITSKSRNQTVNGWVANLPISVNAEQWEKVCVPVLLDPRISKGRGVLLPSQEQPVLLKNSVIGPDGEVAVTSSGIPLVAGTRIGVTTISNEFTGDLFAEDQAEFLSYMSKIILEYAGAFSL